MKYSKYEIKKTAAAAFEFFTGARPKFSDIHLLEASDDRTYILFRVRDIEYSFTSYICERFTDAAGNEIESIWCGDGTLERLGRRSGATLIK